MSTVGNSMRTFLYQHFRLELPHIPAESIIGESSLESMGISPDQCTKMEEEFRNKFLMVDLDPGFITPDMTIHQVLQILTQKYEML